MSASPSLSTLTTDTMELEQVIVCSGGAESNHQIKLLAFSQSVDDHVIEAIANMSPDRNGLAYGQSESINFFQFDKETFGLSRSVIAGLECRRNRGRRVASHTVVIRREQFEGYDNNAVQLARVLLTMGSLIMRTEVASELPLLEVPERSFCPPESPSLSDSSANHDRIAHAIDIHGKVVILGLNDPLEFLSGLLAATESSKRLEISFATGLQVVENRDFTLQFFEDPDPVLAQDLAKRQHRTISLKSEQELH